MTISRKGVEYQVHHGHEWFWPTFADGSWEPQTFEIFDRFLSKDHAMLDIGAWIGPTVLYAAPKAKMVYAFEPDPIAGMSLAHNIHYNNIENTIVYPVAVSNFYGRLPFGIKGKLGDSMSSELWAKGNAWVPAIPLETLVRDLRPNFIKIDIEGGEKNILTGASQVLEEVKPTIHLSLHTPWFKGDEYKNAIIEGLKMYPYIYDEHFNLIKLEDACKPDFFNSIIATYQKI